VRAIRDVRVGGRRKKCIGVNTVVVNGFND